MSYPLHDEFEIDVDLANILGAAEPALVSDQWYHLLRPRAERPRNVQAKIERAFRNTLFRTQWMATRRRAFDRRRALRAPVISRVHVDGGRHLVATNISLSGICASGEPLAPVMDIEFKIPGLPFPVDTRVEVMSYKDSPVIPLVGLRFVDLEDPYREQIARFVGRKRERLLNAA